MTRKCTFSLTRALCQARITRRYCASGSAGSMLSPLAMCACIHTVNGWYGTHRSVAGAFSAHSAQTVKVRLGTGHKCRAYFIVWVLCAGRPPNTSASVPTCKSTVWFPTFGRPTACPTPEADRPWRLPPAHCNNGKQDPTSQAAVPACKSGSWARALLGPRKPMPGAPQRESTVHTQ